MDTQIPLYLPFLFYGLMLFGLACGAVAHTRSYAFIPVVVLLAIGAAQGALGFAPLAALALLSAAVFLYIDHQRYAWLSGRRCLLLNWLIIPLSLAVAFKAFGGVTNPLLYEAVQVSSAARPFSLALGWDKGVLALLLWTLVSSRLSGGGISPVRALWLVPLMLAALFPLGVALGYVAPDLKMPPLTLFAAWAASNLLITCVLEEAFFRGIIQSELAIRWQRFRWGFVAALVLTSLLFGIAHLGGGWMFVLLATIAGLFYGLGYALTRRLWFAVLLHFTVNLVNFVGFTYPALQ